MGEAETRLTHDYTPPGTSPFCPASLTPSQFFFKSTPSLRESGAGNLFWALLQGDPAQDKYLLHRGFV